MITWVNDVKGQEKIEVSLEVRLDDTKKLPTPPDGHEWVDVSCVADYFRGVRVLILEKVQNG